MENNNRPVDFDRLRTHIGKTTPCPDEAALRPQELMDAVKARLSDERFQDLLPTGAPFLSEICEFYEDMANKQEEMMQWYRILSAL
jgi:DNA-directed RNA polymerase III subunit RPC1